MISRTQEKRLPSGQSSLYWFLLSSTTGLLDYNPKEEVTSRKP